jgi:hypothetical protein
MADPRMAPDAFRLDVMYVMLRLWRVVTRNKALRPPSRGTTVGGMPDRGAMKRSMYPWSGGDKKPKIKLAGRCSP